MAFQTGCRVPPGRLWGDGENPSAGNVGGSNHSDRLMLRESVCGAGCGTHAYLEETPERVPVFSQGVDHQSIVSPGTGWQPQGR